MTQAYSLFTTILCWVMQRIRIPEDEISTPDDEIVRAVLKKLEEASVASDPWQVHPTERVVNVGTTRVRVPAPRGFEGHTAKRLLINLRNTTAHGDARKVTPFNVPIGGARLLAGFTFTCHERDHKWEGEITLLESDLRRIGGALTTLYCNALRRSEAHRGDSQFGSNAARSVREVAA